ncbi:MAG TPA: HAD-IA family hydrolase [Alphaproteobacteria bacterium]|nr:HAD-IA family hydrolase [Alphaproteobacteria bacterium]
MGPNSRPRLVVFDCDGTLVDSQHVIVACMLAAYAAHGLAAPEPSAIRRVIGLPLLECMARLSPGHPEDSHTRLTEAYKEAFYASRQRPDHHEPLFDGAVAALDRLEAQGYLLGIATGKARRGLDAVLDRHNLARRFVTLQTGDQGPGKPHPAMLERAMIETGVAPEDVFMIGDTSYDMLMARNAGVHAIGVGWGYHPAEELRAAGAHAVIGSFDELPATFPSFDRSVACA